VLRELEERGRARRGYFVEGLGGAQFALPAAVDRLRAERGEPATDDDAVDVPPATLLAASDPANPYGSALAWPRWSDDDRRPLARAAGAYVVLIGGEPVLYLGSGGKSIETLPALARPNVAQAALAALRQLPADGRMRQLQIERVDGQSVADSPYRDMLAAAGFRAGYRGWLLRV
jgi:ATP-dependent Lhr-like helicase